MKSLRKIFIAVCILKVISLFLYQNIIPGSKEIDRFYEHELYRKYEDHSMEAGMISISSEEFDNISRDSVRQLLGGNRSKDSMAVFHRYWFQGYAKYLETLDTSHVKHDKIDLNRFPSLLQNAVAEENALEKIHIILDNLQRSNKPFQDWNLKGIIIDIRNTEDSLQIALVPFAYESKLHFYHCQCDTNSLPLESNPFYYTGPLLNCQCNYQNKATKEDVTVALQRL
jgi:hypothetical protein